jgi:lysophospholipase L1-like esterase
MNSIRPDYPRNNGRREVRNKANRPRWFWIPAVAVSAIGIIGISYFAYRRITRPAEPLVYQGKEHEYALSFYNTKGQKISDPNGKLKLVMNPYTIYANYPNQATARYSTNPDGFRDGYLKPSAQKLAIVIGGSAAFGQGLYDNNDTFASIISRYNHAYNVINAGTTGYLSGQELSLMVHYLDEFHPSLYIVFDGWNDIYDPDSYIQNCSWPVQGGPIGFNNAFFMMEDRLATVERQSDRDKAVSPRLPLSNALPAYDDEDQYFREVVSTYVANIGKMSDFARARKADILIVFQPELGNKKSPSPHESSIIAKWEKHYHYMGRGITNKYNRLIQGGKQYCREHDIRYININEDPRFNENTGTLFFDIVHPNEEGHKIIAGIINDLLTVKD